MYREKIILPWIQGKSVLDCGGIDHGATEIKSARGDWLHALLAANARECIGVDILANRVASVNEEGRYKFVVANVEEMRLDRKFDVVMAGELVEHIYNMGRFLDCAWYALEEGGTLIISTPNRFALTSSVRAFVFGTERCHPEHTCWYSPQTLRYIVERHGFSVVELHTADRVAKNKVVDSARIVVGKFRPILREKIVLIAQKIDQQRKFDGKW